MNDTERNEAARAVLRANDRGGYTVPTDRLYPFQWNWDSAFVAMGFATFDPDRAYREIERLLEGQWADARIPHIVFHAPSDDYFPGSDVWQVPHTPPTGGIVQPPVLGSALRFVHEAASAAGLKGADERTRALLEPIRRNHTWWRDHRDPDDVGLVSILHPWESGSDNSPAWDAALARVPTTTTTVIRRKDTGHVDPSMRPTDADYARFIHLVDAYREVGWDASRMWQVAPFKVADLQTTAILARASEDLADLSATLGDAIAAVELSSLASHLRRGMTRQWRPALSRFVNRDLVSGEDVLAPTQAGFLPFLGLNLPPDQRDAMSAEFARWTEGLVVGLPTVPRFDGSFDPRRYWRGPVWAVVNWLLVDGLRRNGLDAQAESLRVSTLDAIRRAGFAEYFDPVTGEGLGGGSFSWTAAAWLVLSRA